MREFSWWGQREEGGGEIGDIKVRSWRRTCVQRGALGKTGGNDKNGFWVTGVAFKDSEGA